MDLAKKRRAQDFVRLRAFLATADRYGQRLLDDLRPGHARVLPVMWSRNFRHRQRTVSWETVTSSWSVSSPTWRKLSGKRRYGDGSCAMTSAEQRVPSYDADPDNAVAPLPT